MSGVRWKQHLLIYAAILASILAYFFSFVFVKAERSDIYFLYLHVPAAWVCYLAFSISLAGSVAFIAKRSPRSDIIAENSAILGLLFGAIALIVGSLWAKVAWNAYWNWDPRETTTLILWLAYAGYLSLKLSIENEEKRALVGAVYNIFAFSTIPLSYLSVNLWFSLHPKTSAVSMSLPVISALLINLLSATLLFALLLLMLNEMRILERRIDMILVASSQASEESAAGVADVADVVKESKEDESVTGGEDWNAR